MHSKSSATSIPALIAATLCLLLSFGAPGLVHRANSNQVAPSLVDSVTASRGEFRTTAAPYPSCTYQKVGGATACGGAKLAYDAAGGFVLAYMVCALSAVSWTSCTWKYSNGTWSNITPRGTNPPAILNEAFVWDEADQAALLFGGYTFPAGLGQAWEFKDGAWSNITSDGAPRIEGGILVVAAYDSTDGYVVSLWQSQYLNASYTYVFQAGRWTNITATAGTVLLPWQPIASDDPTDGGALFFGGFFGGPAGSSGATSAPVVPTNRTWLFSHGAWEEGASTPSPPPRALESMTFDPFLPGVLMVGGTQRGCLATCPAYTDEWTLAHGRWANITPSLRGELPQEVWGEMVADVADGYVLEGFGMTEYVASGSAPYQTDLFEFSNGTWTAIHPESVPATPPTLLIATVVAGGAGAAVIGVLIWHRRRRRNLAKAAMV